MVAEALVYAAVGRALRLVERALDVVQPDPDVSLVVAVAAPAVSQAYSHHPVVVHPVFEQE